MDRSAATSSTWGELSEGLQLGLRHEGLEAPDLLHALWDGDDSGASDVAAAFGGTQEDVAVLGRLWRLSKPGADLVHRRVAAIPMHVIGASALRADASAKRRRTEEVLLRGAVGGVPGEEAPRAVVPPAAVPTKWPSRLRRSTDLEGVSGARAIVEEAQRSKWAGVVAEVVREAGLPLALAASELSDPGAILSRCAHGASRPHHPQALPDWAKARRFFQTAWGALGLSVRSGCWTTSKPWLPAVLLVAPSMPSAEPSRSTNVGAVSRTKWRSTNRPWWCRRSLTLAR